MNTSLREEGIMNEESPFLLEDSDIRKLSRYALTGREIDNRLYQPSEKNENFKRFLVRWLLEIRFSLLRIEKEKIKNCPFLYL